jgi:hypothetical protein
VALLNSPAHARFAALRLAVAMLFMCVRFIDIEVLILSRAINFALCVRRTYINPTGNNVNTFFVEIFRIPKSAYGVGCRTAAAARGDTAAGVRLDKRKGICYSLASLDSVRSLRTCANASDFDYLLMSPE